VAPANHSAALLQVTAFIDHENHLDATKMLDNVSAQVVAHCVLVPHRPRQQMLHRIRSFVAGVLGQRPAILDW
jgi:hypothetical protein